MSDVTVPVWWEGHWIEAPVAAMGGEAVVVPNVAALVLREGTGELLLQRRDKAEVVRGLLEIPTGRWRAGETPWEALRREVAEETGLVVRSMSGEGRRLEVHPGRPVYALQPAAVVVGAAGAYPALLVAFTCLAEGEPRPLPGETADPRWYPIDEVRALLDEPAQFTGVAHAVLAAWLEA
jgi:8-oxo-dGTP pyrophosphatase MutT (NUDIX family)